VVKIDYNRSNIFLQNKRFQRKKSQKAKRNDTNGFLKTNQLEMMPKNGQKVKYFLGQAT